MPLYEFKCPRCGSTEEVMLTIANRDSEVLCGCGTQMDRIISTSPIQFNANGFYITDNTDYNTRRKWPKKEKTDFFDVGSGKYTKDRRDNE